MSLYDDEDLGAPPNEVAVGWSTGIKLMQSQLQAKKAASVKPTLAPPMGPPKSVPNMIPMLNKPRTSSAPILAPVIDLKSKKAIVDTDSPSPSSIGKVSFQKPERMPSARNITTSQIGIQSFNEPNFVVNNEYDPLWPNDYHKVVHEMHGDKRKDDEDSDLDNRKRRYTEEGRAKAWERFGRDESSPAPRSSEPSGFGRRPRADDDYSDDEEDDFRRKSSRRSAGSSTGGAAIAPPPSLTETSNPSSSSGSPPSIASLTSPFADKGPGSIPGLGVAAKIMAKYGYKKGQGLGKAEQGMAQALSVEKTSKRGGRIVHEKDLMPPPMFGESFKTSFGSGEDNDATPPQVQPETDEYGDPIMVPNPNPLQEIESEPKPSITDLMKNPSKVVLCQNMVGPGEVDDDLEPEIKEECNTKYGDVHTVVIYEIPNTTPEKAVRIFVEFKRVESAIKAVVDLNGRFFGGREVRATFYNVDKFKSLDLND